MKKMFLFITFGVTTGQAVAQQQGDLIIYSSQGQSAKEWLNFAHDKLVSIDASIRIQDGT